MENFLLFSNALSCTVEYLVDEVEQKKTIHINLVTQTIIIFLEYSNNIYEYITLCTQRMTWIKIL